MTIHELTRRFPRASAAFLRANCADVEELPAQHQEPPQGGALESDVSGEATCRRRAHIRFDFYATRPADFDGYDQKHCIDLLVQAGILCGDEWDVLEGSAKSHKVQKRQEERTVITITKL